MKVYEYCNDDILGKNEEHRLYGLIQRQNNLYFQQIRHELTVIEQKIILYAISKIPPNSVEIPPITMPLSEILYVCNMGCENHTYLKAVLQKLDNQNLWLLDDKGDKTLIRWFSGIDTSLHKSEITLQFHPMLSKYLLQLRRNLSIPYMLDMNSKYSIKLYEYLQAHADTGIWEINLDEFRFKMLGAEWQDYYPIFADFRKRVIEPAVQEINLCSDLEVEWCPIRKGKTYDKLQFSIDRKCSMERDSEKQDIEQEQHVVVKSNDLIRKIRCNLSAEEQKIILYALSKISKDDVALHDMTFDILEFSRLCGLEGKAYARIKDSLTNLQSKPFWIEMSNGVKTYVHWFSKIHIKQYSGKVIIKFHDDLAPYILQPKNGFTSFSIYPMLAMESKYSIRLYELLKSYEAIGDWWFTIEDFQKKLDATNYQLFGNLKQKVIDVSVKEINLYSDLDVSWQPVKEGRKVTKIQFHISHKPPFFEEQAKKHVKDELDVKNNSIEQKLYELMKTRNTLSTQQQKLLLLLIAQIQPDDDDFTEYEISVRDYCILCDVVCGGKIYQDIWESIEDIAKIQIKDVRLSNGERTVLSWIENPCYIQGEGRIKMMVNPYVKPILLELKKNFTQSELLNVLCMKSKYGVRLYELICSADYHDQKAHSNYLTIEDIRELLSVPEGTYPEFKSLKARVLDVAVQEIEEYSDKRVTYTVDRRGRTPVGVKITIDTKPSVFTGFRDSHMTDEEAAGVNHLMDMMIAAKQQIMLRKTLYNE